MNTILELIKSFIKMLFLAPAALLQEVGTVTTDAVSFSGSSTIGEVVGLLNSAVTNFLPFIQTLGYLIATMFFILGLIDLCVSERLTLETFIKQFAYLALGVGAVFICPKLYEGIFNFGNALSTFVATNFNPAITGSPLDAAAQLDTALDAVMSESMAWLPVMILGVLIAPITIIIAAALLCVIYVISFSRVIEIAARGCLMPIGFALLGEDGWRGAGGRYFKKMLAVCSQGAAIAIVGNIMSGLVLKVQTKMFEDLATGMPADFFGAMAQFCKNSIMSEIIVIGVAVAGIAMLFKSLQLVNDAFGC